MILHQYINSWLYKNVIRCVRVFMICAIVMFLFSCDPTAGPTIEDHTFKRVLFTKQASSTDARAIAPVSGGGYIIAGRELGDYANTGKVYVARLNGQGELMWRQMYGKQRATNGGAYDMIRTSDGNYVITGSISSKLYLLKIDAEGNMIWEHHYNRISSAPDASTIDIGFGLTETDDGSLIVVGRTLLSFDSAGNGLLVPSVLKVNGQGEKIWFKAYSEVIDRGDAYEVVVQPDGRLQIMGRPSFKFTVATDDGHLLNHVSNRSATYEDIKCIKKDNSCVGVGANYYSDQIVVTKSRGDKRTWSKTLGTGVAKALTLTHDRDIVGVGWQKDSGEIHSYIFKLSASGKLRWDLFIDKPFTGVLYDVMATPTGDIVAVGRTSHFRKGYTNAVIIRVTADGKLQ